MLHLKSFGHIYPRQYYNTCLCTIVVCFLFAIVGPILPACTKVSYPYSTHSLGLPEYIIRAHISSFAMDIGQHALRIRVVIYYSESQRGIRIIMKLIWLDWAVDASFCMHFFTLLLKRFALKKIFLETGVCLTAIPGLAGWARLALHVLLIGPASKMLHGGTELMWLMNDRNNSITSDSCGLWFGLLCDPVSIAFRSCPTLPHDGRSLFIIPDESDCKAMAESLLNDTARATPIARVSEVWFDRSSD